MKVTVPVIADRARQAVVRDALHLQWEYYIVAVDELVP
jgi:hypothetical protein